MILQGLWSFLHGTNLLYLAAGGFLLGNVAYTGWYTTRYEPKTKPGYAFIGVGAFVVIAIATYLDFYVDEISDWYEIGTFIGYFLVAVGLGLITRECRRRSDDSNSSTER